MNACRTLAAGLAGAMLMTLAASPAPADDNAVIKGKVIFGGDPAKNKRTVINTQKDPNCKKNKKKIELKGGLLDGATGRRRGQYRGDERRHGGSGFAGSAEAQRGRNRARPRGVLAASLRW